MATRKRTTRPRKGERGPTQVPSLSDDELQRRRASKGTAARFYDEDDDVEGGEPWQGDGDEDVEDDLDDEFDDDRD